MTRCSATLRAVLSPVVLASMLAGCRTASPPPASIPPPPPPPSTTSADQIGPLYFDPLGAGFTLWVQHFKDEVYRNWLIPQSVLGVRGEVQYEFTVQRDGRMTDLTLLQTSGSPPMDRAARGALLGGHLLPLPADYPEPAVTMRITFYYSRPRE